MCSRPTSPRSPASVLCQSSFLHFKSGRSTPTIGAKRTCTFVIMINVAYRNQDDALPCLCSFNDLVINCAQIIMRSQFPHLVDGFQSTLLLPTLWPFDSWMPNYIQIVHVQSRRHGITVTTKDCSCGEVIVYDTLFDNIDCSTKIMLERLFSCGKE